MSVRMVMMAMMTVVVVKVTLVCRLLAGRRNTGLLLKFLYAASV